MRYLLTIAFLLMATSSFAVNLKTYTVCESGCDYTTVAAAESAHAQDLVANDSAITFEIQNTWASAEASWVVGGSTTDATRFLTVQAVGAAKASATWSTTSYRVESADVSTVQLQDDYIVIDGIQVLNTKTTGGRGIIGQSGAAPLTIINCIVQCESTSGGFSIVIQPVGVTGNIIRNCVSFDSNSGIESFGTGAGGTKIDNCTVENCTVGIKSSTSEAVIARNNILWNCTTPLSGNFNTTTLSEENYTDAGSLSYGSCGSCGTGDQLSQSDPFVSIAGEDYHLASGATAIDAGKDLSGDFTDDIDGDTRDANFDKGADEFIAAAAAGTTLEGVTLQGVTIE